MAEIKKYLDTVALGTLVDEIKKADAATLASAKGYADGLAKNYDAAGSASTAESNAKAYADTKVNDLANGQVKTNKEAIEGIVADYLKNADKEELQGAINSVDAIADKNAEDIAAINNVESGILAQAKSYTDVEVAEVQGNVDTLSSYVGEFTHETAKTVVEYINAKTDGIATSGNLEALAGRVTTVEGEVATIKGDYLKSTDKTELEGQISAKADQTALDEVSGVANAAATKVALEEEVNRAKGEESRIEGLVTAEAERAAGVESGLDARIKAVEDDYLKAADKTELQGNIDTVSAAVELLTNGVGTDEIDSVNELINYVKEHGTEVTGMQGDIAQNASDIDAIESKLGTVAEGAQVNVIEVVKVNGEALTVTDKSVDVIVPTGALASKNKVAESDLETELATKINGKADQTALDNAVLALEGVDAGLDERLQVVEAQLGDGENSVSDLIATAKQEAIDTAAGDATTKANTAETNAKTYADGLNTAMDTRVAVVEGKAHEHANKALLDTYTQTEVNLADAVAKKHEHSNLAVLEGITSEKVAAWNAAEGNAKTYADGLNSAMTTKVDGIGSRVGTLETTIVDKAEQDDLDAAVLRIAANETAIAANTSAINSFTPITSEEVVALFA